MNEIDFFRLGSLRTFEIATAAPLGELIYISLPKSSLEISSDDFIGTFAIRCVRKISTAFDSVALIGGEHSGICLGQSHLADVCAISASEEFCLVLLKAEPMSRRFSTSINRGDVCTLDGQSGAFLYLQDRGGNDAGFLALTDADSDRGRVVAGNVSARLGVIAVKRRPQPN